LTRTFRPSQSPGWFTPPGLSIFRLTDSNDAMRTYDKLIATIPGRQGTGSLRSSLGVDPAAAMRPPRQAGG